MHPGRNERNSPADCSAGARRTGLEDEGDEMTVIPVAASSVDDVQVEDLLDDSDHA